jgi:HDOD domain
MTSQLVLILVLVAAGLVIVAALSLRASRRNAREAKTVPATAGLLTPAPAESSGGAHAAGTNSAPPGQPHEQPAPASTPPGETAKGSQESPRIFSPMEIFAKLNDLALGTSRPSSMISAGHADVVAATALALQNSAAEQRYTPRRPNMLPRVLNASNDDDFSRRELAALISRDSSLVGNLLKIANSSYYRVTPEPVESVDRAVVLLGTEGIRSVVTAALMQPIFRIGGADFPRFPEIAWEHTFRSATAAVSHNFLLEKSDPFAAELLCHVMGLAGIVVFRVVMDQYAARPRLRPDAGVVGTLLEQHSTGVARRIGATWELSEQTLTGLDGQACSTTTYPTALGRSLYFGRVVGALAVLRSKRVLDERTARASIPATTIPEAQLERLWARVSPRPRKD